MAVALPRERSGDFGTSPFYGQHSETPHVGSRAGMHKRGLSKIFCTAASLSQLSVIPELIGKGPCPSRSVTDAGQNKRPRDAGPSCSDLVRVIVAWVVTSEIASNSRPTEKNIECDEDAQAARPAIKALSIMCQ